MVRWIVVRVFLAAIAVCGCMSGDESPAAVVWDEATNGDLSGNGLSPSKVDLAYGTNSIVGATQAGDLDYVSVTSRRGMN